MGGQAFPVALDVMDKASVVDAIAAATREFGPIDILVNSAGIAVEGSVLDQTEKHWDAVLDTNLKGAFLVATEVARQMRSAGKGGSLINIASILGLRQASRVASYAVSKAGLVQLTQIMALELARYNIRVNALAPGYIETDLNHEFLASPAGLSMVKRIPQRRFGKSEDLDAPLLLLASDDSRYMTGVVVVVDGGHLVSTL